MIDTKTTFILGAGSNMIYGFPSGRKLRYNIIKNFEKELNQFRSFIPSGYMISAKSFVNDFKDSNIQSIDKFLNLRRNYYDIGKIAIAIEILKAEKESKFAEDLEVEERNRDWYFFLYNKMLDEIDNPNDFLKFKDNTISFVTFNYDRSFDYFLYNSFRNSFPSEIFQAQHTVNIFPFEVIHMYGAPKLGWQDINNNLDYCRHYEYDERTVNDIRHMADSMKIIYDERDSDENFVKAQSALMNSDRVFFLGFGYAKENLEILGIPNRIKDKNIYGTVLGCTKNEIIKIRKDLGAGHLNDTDCMMLLRLYL